MRITRRKGLVLAGIAAIAGLLLLVTSSPFQQWLLRRVENYAREAGFPFTASRLRLRLTALQAFLDGFVYDQNGQRLQIDHLKIDLPWNAIGRGVVRITSVEADHAVVRIQPQNPGTPTPSSVPGSPAASKPPMVQIDRISIRNASVSYESPVAGVEIPSVAVEATNGRGRIRFDAPVTIAMTTTVTMNEIPFELSEEAIRLGPAAWTIRHSTYEGSGSAHATVQWSPGLAANAEITTEPIAIDQWKGIRLNAKASYSDGVFNVSEFRASQGPSEISGTAKIAEAGTSANLSWKDVSLAPGGLVARTNGSMKVEWKKPDLSDLQGEAQATIISRNYGTSESRFRIADRQATVELQARAWDLAIRAHITAVLDQVFKGNFREIKGTLRGDVQPLSGSPAYQRLGPVSVSAAGSFVGNVLTLSDIRARSGESTISGAMVQADWGSKRLRGRIPQSRIVVHDFAPDLVGTIDLSGDFAGSIDRPSASFSGSSGGLDYGNTHIDEVRLEAALSTDSRGVPEIRGMVSGTAHLLTTEGQVPPIRVSAKGTFRNDIVNIEDISATAKGSNLSATLQLNLNDKRIRGSVPLAQIDVGDFVPQVAGLVKLNAEVDGTLDHPMATFTGASSGLDVSQTHIDNIGMDGRFDNDVLTLTRFEAHQSEGVLTASGSLNLTTEAVDAAANISNLKITEIADLSTTASLTAQAGGSYRSPSITFEGQLRDVIYRQQDHGNVHIQGTTNLKEGTVRATSDKYAASIDGQMTFEPPYVFVADLKATNSEIQYQEYKAIADGRVRATGEMQPFKASSVSFDKFGLSGEGIELSADGSIDTGVRTDLLADLSKLPIKGVVMGGTAQVHATISGDLNDPSVEGLLTTDGAKARTTEMSESADVSAQVDFTGQGFSIRTLRAEFAGGTATIAGQGSWQGTGKFQFDVVNIRPEMLVPGKSVSGIASLQGDLDVKSPHIEDISGRVKVNEFDITVKGVQVRQVQPIEAEVRNQVLTVRSFELEGLQTHASVTGHADLKDQTLDFNADADTDLAILEPFIPNSHPSGRIKTRVALAGTTDKPNLDGFVSITGGEVAIEHPDVELSDVNVEAQLRGDRIELSRASGLVNNGTFVASGGTGIASTGLRDTSIQLKIENGQLEYPEGLQSEFSSQLKIEGSMPNLTLSGTVNVLNAAYEKEFKLTQAVFARITAPPPSLQPATQGGVASQIRMDVEVRTQEPVLIKNNVADLQATGTFSVRGTAANPIILGRANVLEGGELYFGPAVDNQAVETARRSDRYAIEHGSIDFNNPLRTEPELDFLATHELEIKDERYLITLKVTGTPATLKAELTSDPSEDQSDIIAMLLTGRTVQELQGTYASVAGEQALGYVSGRLSERVLNQAGQVIGLNMVRIDPVTVANQTDLAARLTLAKDVTHDFSLVYSQVLSSAKAQTWIAEYKPLQNFVLRGINDAEKNEVTVDLNHNLRFGGGATLIRKKPANEARLRNVTFTGTQFAAKDLEKKVTKEGNPFGPYRVTQDVRSLRRYLASQGYPKARIEAEQDKTGDNVDVRFNIMEGPRIDLAYQGADVPKDLKIEIEQVWTMRPSDAASVRDSTNRLLRHFRSEGYLQAKVSVNAPSATGDARQYVFTIDRGNKFDKPSWSFHGVDPIDIGEPAGVVMESPELIKERIESHFRDNGYLDVQSTEPMLVIDGTRARFEVMVNSGKQYTVENIEFEGNNALDAQSLRGFLAEGTKKKDEPVRFTAEWLENARQKITSEYWKRGYNEVQIVPSTNQNSSSGHATVRFAITEGELQHIEAIEVNGASVTSRAYIERQFEFKKGDPLDYTKVNLTRKKLYDTRLFRRVEIDVKPGPNGHVATLNLTENAPWQFRYGLAVTEQLEDGDRQIGVASDLTYNNLFGRAMVIGFSGKLNTDERDARVFGSSPQFFGKKVTTSVTLFRTRDLTDPNDIVDYWGTTVQQQWRLGQHYLLSYDYSYRKVLRGQTSGGAGDEESVLDNPRVPIARFNTTISRDTRDDILNATRGSFISNSYEVAPPGIGSSIEFMRNFSQYFRFDTVRKIVFASAVRVGFAGAFHGQELDPTLQFEAGGGTTVRAFKQDELTREPGNYELILNGEIRYPLFWKFSAATFLDAGQVTNRTEDLFKFRYGPGLGIRIATPFVLLRTDVGINISPRPGEARGRWSFGIGQAF